MSGLLAKAGALFIAPAAEAQTFAPPRPRAAVVGVLAEARDLLVVAGAEASALRREVGAPFALVCLHGVELRPAPARRAATQAAAKLGRREIAASAAGALCLVAADDARAATAAVDAPVVIAATRRDPEIDALLTAADHLVLGAAADALLTNLAVEDLAHLGPPVAIVTPTAGLLARQAARLGFAPAPAQACPA